MSPPMNGPSKRRMQVEAWGVVLTLIIVGWCFVGGLWMGAKLIWALARMALGV
jgi:hypothetical protein